MGDGLVVFVVKEVLGCLGDGFGCRGLLAARGLAKVFAADADAGLVVLAAGLAAGPGMKTRLTSITNLTCSLYRLYIY